MTDGTFFRAIRPSWSFAPLSGEGAARNGGRWNPKGTAALYLAGDPMTALAEYNQDVYFRPVTLAEYQVRNARLASCLSDTAGRKHDIGDDALTTNWRAQTLQGQTPETWQAAVRLCAAGFHGLLYPSRINGGVCLVIWAWNSDAGCSISVADRHGYLPRDNQSWPGD